MYSICDQGAHKICLNSISKYHDFLRLLDHGKAIFSFTKVLYFYLALKKYVQIISVLKYKQHLLCDGI